MLTRNWYRVASYLIVGQDANYVPLCKNVKDTEVKMGTSYNLPYWTLNNAAKYLRTSYASGTTAYGLYFGTGNTPPSLDDYKLSGDIISGITVSYAVTSAGDNIDSDHAEITMTFTITNGNTQEITIREVALVTMAGIMVERTVLDTPVTIPAGGIGQVTYTIRMNYPTA